MGHEPSSFLTGEIRCFAGISIPMGWVECGGQVLSRTGYARLFALIGITYGAGDGSTTFNVPDLRGRTPAGRDNLGGLTANRLTAASGIIGTTLGASGGTETVTLTGDQSGIAGHAHTLNNHTHIVNSHNHGGGSHTHAHGEFGFFSAAAGASTYLNNNATTSNTAGPSATVIQAQAPGTGAPSNNNTSDVLDAVASSAHPSTQPTIILNYIIKY